MHDPSPERPPRSANEWGVLVILSVFFAFLMTWELARDFSFEKWSVPIFFASWIILLVIHEFGHAIMALLVGWRVRRICIGSGKRFYVKNWIRNIPIEIRAIPLSGYVLPQPTSMQGVRWKSFLIYAAGPGIEILIVLALLAIFGSDRLLSPPEDFIILSTQTFCVAAVFGSLINLIPFPHQTDKGEAWTDGLGMIMCWQVPDEIYQKQIEGA